MRIGIDMRMAGTGEGIGRYIEELVKNLAEIDRVNEYYLLFNKKFPLENFEQSNFYPVKVESGYYSWAEQTKFIFELNALQLDLVHFASFNAPLFYQGDFIVTIHDIIHHKFPGKKKTRYYQRLAYRTVFWTTLHRAKKIITVSDATKEAILNEFELPKDKLEVIHEGVNSKFFKRVNREEIEKVKNKFSIKKPYILFVGVWRQYKNLPRLAKAFDMLRDDGLGYQLVLAGKIDSFYPEIKKQVFDIKNSADIIATGYVPDEDLPALYQGASLFVLPSLIEGFGLIGVEAMASGIPVVCSDIKVLREIYQNAAEYFNPKDVNDIQNKIKAVLTREQGLLNLEEKGQLLARQYDWKTAAHKTLHSYMSISEAGGSI